MNEYEHIPWRGPGPGLSLYRCAKCGAVIERLALELHTKWHDNQQVLEDLYVQATEEQINQAVRDLLTKMAIEDQSII